MSRTTIEGGENEVCWVAPDCVPGVHADCAGFEDVVGEIVDGCWSGAEGPPGVAYEEDCGVAQFWCMGDGCGHPLEDGVGWEVSPLVSIASASRRACSSAAMVGSGVVTACVATVGGCVVAVEGPAGGPVRARGAACGGGIDSAPGGRCAERGVGCRNGAW